MVLNVVLGNNLHKCIESANLFLTWQTATMLLYLCFLLMKLVLFGTVGEITVCCFLFWFFFSFKKGGDGESIAILNSNVTQQTRKLLCGRERIKEISLQTWFNTALHYLYKPHIWFILFSSNVKTLG